jgi:hypothetical protein
VNSCDEGRTDRTQTRKQNSELSFRVVDLEFLCLCHLYFFRCAPVGGVSYCNPVQKDKRLFLLHPAVLFQLSQWAKSSWFRVYSNGR